MEQFLEDGHDVTNSDIDTHTKKVTEEKYALIVDYTGALVFASQHCGYDMLQTTAIPAPYAVGLQKNSAMTGEVNMM